MLELGFRPGAASPHPDPRATPCCYAPLPGPGYEEEEGIQLDPWGQIRRGHRPSQARLC